MQVKHRQKTKNGCGSLSIANIFDDHRFTVGLEKLPGERIYDLNRKMSEMGYEVFIDCLFLTHAGFKVGNGLKLGHSELFRLPRHITKKIKENYAVPLLFCIANSRGRNSHMVAVIHSVNDNMFHMIDSTKEKIIIMSYPELLKRFHIISVSIFRVIDHQDQGNFVMMPKSELPHIFNPND